MSAGSIKDVLDRLFSLDANDRVKAANEIGEIGTENEAPVVLKVAYEDEASTVRQMAIQSYYEIMKENGFDEIKQAAMSHTDVYVRIYAINILGRFNEDLVGELLKGFTSDPDTKIRATSIKAMIHSKTKQNAKYLENMFNQETNLLTRANIVEAWALWRYIEAKEIIKKTFNQESKEQKSTTLRTIAALALASFDDKEAIEYLKESEIDEYYRIKINHKYYSGRNGLLQAIEELKKLK